MGNTLRQKALPWQTAVWRDDWAVHALYVQDRQDRLVVQPVTDPSMLRAPGAPGSAGLTQNATERTTRKGIPEELSADYSVGGPLGSLQWWGRGAWLDLQGSGVADPDTAQ